MFVYAMQPVAQPVVVTTGCTTGCIVYTNSQPVVKPAERGNWTTRGYANSRIANSRTGQVADWSMSPVVVAVLSTWLSIVAKRSPVSATAVQGQSPLGGNIVTEARSPQKLKHFC